MVAGMQKIGKLAYRDTGAVPGSTDYTTIAIVHGFGYSNGVFRKLEPLAAQNNARLVLINRRDYPGSDPYTEEEHATLASLQSTPNALDLMQQFMADRARELYDFLTKFIAQEDIPAAAGATGGLVVAGWSFGTKWITSFLQQLARFPAGDVELRAYVRRIVLYDPPCHSIGIPLPATKYHPLEDEAIPLPERPLAFGRWVSGYFMHGESLETLELRTPADEPRPSILNFSPEEFAQVFHPGPAGHEGSDLLLLNAGIATGLNKRMKDEGLYPQGEDVWRDVEVRYLWCDRSVFEVPVGMWGLRKELEEEKEAGRPVRNVTIVRLRGANHFLHWETPERALKAFLANEEISNL